MASNSGPSTPTSSHTAHKRPATHLVKDASKKIREAATDFQSMVTMEQFTDLADIKPSHSAAVHGVLLDLSPVKKSKNIRLYVEGRFVCFVRFSNSQYRRNRCEGCRDPTEQVVRYSTIS